MPRAFLLSGDSTIVLLTDGEDAGSQVLSDEVIAYATESDAMIYSIYYAPSPMGPRGRDRPFPGRGGIFGRRGPIQDRQERFPGQRGPRAAQRRDRQGLRGEFAIEFLTRLSEISAGRFYRSETTDLKKTFLLIAEELRNQYRLGFYPDELARDGSMHQLRVKVDRPEIAVRARNQYRASSLAASQKNPEK
jgi:VWFA-related protein